LFAEFTHRVLMFVLMIGILTPIELTISHNKDSLRGRIPGVAYWAIWTLFAMAAGEFFKNLYPHSLITIPVRMAGAWDIVGAPILAAIIGDFYFYFHHRIQHAVPMLWRFHAVHHSIRELNAVNAYHHPFDEFIKTPISFVPLFFFSVEPARSVPAMTLIMAMHPYFLHSPMKADLGWFRQIIGDNRFHRIHHSTDPAHYNKNFGAFTTLWDRLFGTAYWPAKNEWPEVGLREIDEPKSVAEWITLPLRYPSKGQAAEATSAAPSAE
jgi:sterol desaturase/sphingolipid hydroxylase (fatty acid hydroxylase superfamily)